MGIINGVPLNTERSKPKRHRNEVEASDDPIVANKATIAQVLSKLSSQCSTMKASLEERIICPPVIKVIKKAFNQWDLESPS